MASKRQPLHEWTIEPESAIALQKLLAPRIVCCDQTGEISHIAGVDIGFEEGGETTRAVIVVMRWPSLEIVERVLHRTPTRMPYIPGLLSFRELPAALEAFEQLSITPDLLMVDGMGIAHPRRLGIAAHLGLWLDIPAIGVGKSRLCGRNDEVPEARGSWVPLTHRNETIGAVLRTREQVKPLYISIGHRISLERSIHWVMQCLTRYKLPEPTRQADRLASRRTAETRCPEGDAAPEQDTLPF
ncbi:deoxyribonuclease V [Kushneria phyllosphaerae]|uniref:Endonuclease V n=1 Tax=Kushneria phyllosphaerae TaxID=2100822 RepID=A0A2R8CKW4_9GAMM|nr:deoxyribonuclease V [Kushneria phyllosphaerae]SPJ33525.1 Endonuclease V [Kushneria phyllosphaerae]